MATSNNDRVSSAKLLDMLKGLQESRHLGSEPEVETTTETIEHEAVISPAVGTYQTNDDLLDSVTEPDESRLPFRVYVDSGIELEPNSFPLTIPSPTGNYVELTKKVSVGNDASTYVQADFPDDLNIANYSGYVLAQENNVWVTHHLVNGNPDAYFYVWEMPSYTETKSTTTKTKRTIKQDYLPNADWNVNDPDADGYVEGRTHWEEVSEISASVNVQSGAVIGNFGFGSCDNFGKVKSFSYPNGSFVAEQPSDSVSDAIVTFAQYVRETFPNATVIVAQCSWRDSRKAGGGRGTYITVTREYTVGCGKAGFRFVKNSPFALHDYELLDSEGWKPNEDGCEEIAVMFGIELAGGTYDKLGDWRQLAYTVDDKVIIGDDAQNHLFPGDVPDPKPPVMWNYMHNDSVYVWLSFHTIEFKTPTNLIGHLPNGENGEIGQFRLLQFNNPSGYIQPMNNSDFKNFPVTVIDSDGNVRNATLCIRHGASEILCFLYRGKEKQTSHDVGVEFDVFENTKYIHFGAAFGKFKIDAFDC